MNGDFDNMDINLMKLLNNESKDTDKDFFNKIDSKLVMDVNKNKILENNEWLDKVEFTLPYIEKALNKPNKNIMTEEEIIKIELIKKVSIESIKHLSKHADLIDKYNQKTDEVIPKKILNAYKEENYVTYENRFIYSLIKLIEDFIYIRTRDDEEARYKGRDFVKANYEAKTKIAKRNIKFNFEFVSEDTSPKKKSDDAEEKIKNIKFSLKMFKATEIYQLLESKRATLVKSPLKMTNVLLKNVNFQYAVKLWNYLNDNFEQRSKAEENESIYEEKGMVRQLVNENFYAAYLIFQKNLEQQQRTKGKAKPTEQEKKQNRDLLNIIIDKVLETNPDLGPEDLKKVIDERYVIYKNKRIISLQPIEEKFQNKINSFVAMIGELRLK